jgi:predicted acylesterase/phospholipase RssA
MPEPRCDFLSPAKKCDIVMKGGITSGVVYPNAVVKLAQVYRFVNIGGTSAGAIAAAATAAAEYRRSKGSAYGFEKLSELPAFLSATPRGKKHTNLFWLFQPDPEAQMLFDIAVSFTKKGLARIKSLIVASVKGAPVVWIFVGFAAAVLWRYRVTDPVSTIMWLVLVLKAMLAAVIWWKLRRLPARGFGLCPGMTIKKSAPPALTEWFNDFINDLADKRAAEPLTFGDLRDAGIQLRMISTCVTHGRPYGLPIDSAQFYFKEEELKEYFPYTVIEWMKRHPGPEPAGEPSVPVDASGYFRLPPPREMPVVVAARMSLSFPFLFRAVPLHAIDFSLRVSDTPVRPAPGGALPPGQPRRPERCWFLDGGVCSNFPVHMFDAPLPRWPTFGVDLQNIRKDRPDSFVWMPSRNEEGLSAEWDRIPDSSSIAPIATYIAGLINTARNWTDNRQMTVPGFRDRIVHIRLDEKNEGGLNLDMNPKDVQKISDRGRDAATLLIQHFANPDPDVSLNWDNHRWIRLRSVLSRIEDLLAQLQAGWSRPEPGERSYHDLLQRNKHEGPNSYRLTAGQRDFMTSWLGLLLAAASQVGEAQTNERPSRKAPRPEPDLRVLPRTVPGANADEPGTTVVQPQAEGAASVTSTE